MDLNSIRSALREQPFRLFDLWLADGRRVPVDHPEVVGKAAMWEPASYAARAPGANLHGRFF
jgi:hypothetical protein